MNGSWESAERSAASSRIRDGRYIRAALRGMWERSRRGLGFNLLGPGARAPGPKVYVGDAETWARWCSSALPDALVALRYGPPLQDFTVLVRRSR